MRPLSGEDTPTVVAIVALRSSRPLLVKIVYFGAPTASLEALVPDVGQSLPSSLCLTYFALRIGVVVAACLPRWGPRAPRGLRRARSLAQLDRRPTRA